MQEYLSKKHKAVIMLGLTLSVLLAALDSTVVSTAMKKITDDLNGMNAYAWPFTMYMLFSTIATPISGKLGDIFGRKPLYLIGAFTFLTGSGLCGLSQTMLQLIIFRGLQGIGGGMLMSNTFSIIGDIFAPSERAKYTGIAFSAFGLASLIGPSLGGYIADTLGWRWVFYINLPIGIFLVALMISALPVIKADTSIKRKIDYAGTALLVLGLLPMLLAFTWAGKDYNWLSPQILGMLAFSVLMLILFGFVEKKAAEPILPISLFKNNTFKVSAAAAFLSNATMFGAVLFIPLFVQVVIGANATNSGMVTTPMMIGFTVASILSGQAISRFKNLRIFGVAGFILTGIGIFMLTRLTVASTRSEVVIDMVIAGLGIGLNMPVFNLAVQNAFPQSQLGVVTSAVQFFRNIGGTIASAVLGSVMLSSMKTGLKRIDLGTLAAEGSSSLHSIIKDPQSLTNPGTIAGIRAQIPQSAIPEFNKFLIHLKNILSNAIHDVFIVCLLIAVTAILTAFFLPNTPLLKKQDSQSV